MLVLEIKKFMKLNIYKEEIQKRNFLQVVYLLEVVHDVTV